MDLQDLLDTISAGGDRVAHELLRFAPEPTIRHEDALIPRGIRAADNALVSHGFTPNDVMSGNPVLSRLARGAGSSASSTVDALNAAAASRGFTPEDVMSGNPLTNRMARALTPSDATVNQLLAEQTKHGLVGSVPLALRLAAQKMFGGTSANPFLYGLLGDEGLRQLQTVTPNAPMPQEQPPAPSGTSQAQTSSADMARMIAQAVGARGSNVSGPTLMMRGDAMSLAPDDRQKGVSKYNSAAADQRYLNTEANQRKEEELQRAIRLAIIDAAAKGLYGPIQPGESTASMAPNIMNALTERRLGVLRSLAPGIALPQPAPVQTPEEQKKQAEESQPNGKREGAGLLDWLLTPAAMAGGWSVGGPFGAGAAGIGAGLLEHYLNF